MFQTICSTYPERPWYSLWNDLVQVWLFPCFRQSVRLIQNDLGTVCGTNLVDELHRSIPGSILGLGETTP